MIFRRRIHALEERLAALEEAHKAACEAAVSSGEDFRTKDTVAVYRINAVEDAMSELKQHLAQRFG